MTLICTSYTRRSDLNRRLNIKCNLGKTRNQGRKKATKDVWFKKGKLSEIPLQSVLKPYLALRLVKLNTIQRCSWTKCGNIYCNTTVLLSYTVVRESFVSLSEEAGRLITSLEPKKRHNKQDLILFCVIKNRPQAKKQPKFSGRHRFHTHAVLQLCQ